MHLGCGHPNIASFLITVVQLYYKMNDCHRSMRYLSRAQKCSVSAEKVAIVYNILGSASFEAGYLDIALKSFQASLKIEREIGLSSNDIVTTLSNLGKTLSLQENFDEALGYYQIEGENAFATNDTRAKHVLSTLRDIALVCQENGEMDKVLQSLRKAMFFFVEHEGLTSNIDRSALYSSFEVYYLNVSKLQCNADVIVSKHCAPAA